MKIPFYWETLTIAKVCEKATSLWSQGLTFRAKIHGGWIVRHSWTEIQITNDDTETEIPCESMLFIPDPNHEWNP
jgi:hypothetical protein